jgi:hypothetical protein
MIFTLTMEAATLYNKQEVAKNHRHMNYNQHSPRWSISICILLLLKYAIPGLHKDFPKMPLVDPWAQKKS